MGEQRELRNLLSSASLVFVGAAIASVAKLLERIVLGRSLSTAAFGEVNIALTTMSLGVTFALVGFGQGIPRYMSRYEDERDVRGAWLTGLLFAGVVAVAVASVLYFKADFITANLFDKGDSSNLVPVFVLAIPLVVGYQVGVGGIRGFENTIYKTYVGDLLYPFGRIFLLVGLLALGFGPVAAGYAYLISAAVAFVAAHYLLNRLLPLVGEFRLHMREMALFSAPLVVSSVLADLLTRTDTVMLGFFKTSHQVGLYAAAYPLANSLLIALSSFGFLYLPLASRLDANGERDEISSIYQLTTKWIFVVTFPAFLLFVTFPADILTVFFGERYAGGALALVILSLGFFTNAAGGRNRETLSALGHTGMILTGNALAFGLNLVLNLVLIPAHGFVGAAVASAIANVTLNVFMFAVLWLKFGITPFSRWTVRTMTRVPLLLFPPAVVVSRMVSLSVITLPLALAIAAVGTLIAVSAADCLQPEDRVVVDFVEKITKTKLPFLHGYVPEATD
ncbi:flippase [Haladaptatus caseinilyticus]|uniref:flippase n=1 Tax=Haladaptatus caseinilyticus TaxID=2993314 RepID=UPI00224B2F64|nr:flippase [Haladaptatus caseinilyticus]